MQFREIFELWILSGFLKHRRNLRYTRSISLKTHSEKSIKCSLNVNKNPLNVNVNKFTVAYHHTLRYSIRLFNCEFYI